jgi:hypothetical protein
MSSRRRLALLIAMAALLLVAAGVAGVLAVQSASKGPAFLASARLLRDHPAVRRNLGVVTGFGFTVTGSVVESEEEGRARIRFDVVGSWRTGSVSVRALKRGGRWQVVSARLDVGGERIPLRVPGGGPPPAALAP